MKEKILSFWESFKLVLLFLLLIGVAIGMQSFGNEYLSSLGSNLVAEFIGAAITVYGIDALIRHREEKRLLPVKSASYEDVRVMTHWAMALWKEAYVNSVGDSDPKSWDELFSPDSLTKIQLALDITKPANTSPPQPWANYFDGEMERIHRHAEKILERHAMFLEPEVHSAVYTIVYFSNHRVSMILQLDSQVGIPRPKNLGNYVPILKEWFDAVLFLHKWTVKTHPNLQKRGIKNIHPPYSFSPLEVKADPSARFEDGALEAQIRDFLQWQEAQESSREKSL